MVFNARRIYTMGSVAVKNSQGCESKLELIYDNIAKFTGEQALPTDFTIGFSFGSSLSSILDSPPSGTVAASHLFILQILLN